MKKISSKITIAIILCSLILSILLGSVSIFQSSKYLEKEAYEKLGMMGKSYANEFSQQLENVESTVNTLSSQIGATIDLDKMKEDPAYMENYLEKVISPSIERILQDNKGRKMFGAYFYLNPEISGKTGDVWYADLKENENYERQEQLGIEVYDPNDEDMVWFYDHTKEKNKRWGNPYIWDGIDEKIVPYTLGIYKNNTFIGVVGIDIKIQDIENTMKNIKIYDTGYPFLMNGEYDYLIHPTIKDQSNLKTIADGTYEFIAKEMDKNDSGLVKTKFKGEDKILGYAHLTNGWILASVVPVDEIFKPVETLKYIIVGISILGLILSIIIGLYMGKSISKPIVKVTELINRTANFELTDDKSYDVLLENKDETGDMAKSMASLRQFLREFARELIEASGHITKNADKVEMLTGDLKDQALHTLSTTQEISSGIEETAATSEEINASTDQINGAVNSIAQKAEEGAISSSDINERANHLKNTAIASAQKADNIYNHVKKDLDAAIEQAKAVEKINLLADTILQITEQTNLLALNAAIEAARAGESGRGFTVVAEEIRKLAEQSSQTITDIQNVIEIVNISVENLVGNSQKILKFMESDVNEDYKMLIQVGEQYSKDAGFFNHLMMDFSATSEELKASIKDITVGMDEVAKTVNEGASGVEDITNKTSNIVEDLTNIQSSTKENLESARRLKENTSKFKL